MAKRKVQDTSLEAYRNLDPDKISEKKHKIINALAAIGKGNYEDVSKRTHLKPDTCWKRLSDLCSDGLVYRTGERKNLSSGSQGNIFALTEQGRRAVTEGAIPGKGVVDFSKALIQPKPNEKVINSLF